MNIQTSLFEGKLVCLAPIDMEKDTEIEAKWMQDAEYLRLIQVDPARQLSAAHQKKLVEKLEKQQEEQTSFFHFALRTRAEDRLVGFVQIPYLEWNHSTGWLRMGIGDPKDRRKGYGTEALSLMLRFAFTELNLHRLTAAIPEYNQAALALFQKAGFVQEVCRRKALQRDGNFWNLYLFGMLRKEWEAQRQGV